MNYPGSLHQHSDWSNIRLRDSIIKLENAFDYAEELGHKVIGVTEHDFTGGWIKAERLKKKHPNLKIILGNEIYLCRNGLNAQNYNREYDRYFHFCLYSRDRIGARQIMEISTRAWRRSYMARGMRRVPTYYQDLFDIIGAEPGHVIGSTACLGGALPTQLLRYKDTQDATLKEKIAIWIEQMNGLFGDGNFFLEMQPSKNKEQIYVNQRLLDISGATGIPYIITTDSHYLKKEDRIIHKAYLNAQNGDREVDDFYATTYMMGTEELESYFGYLTREQLDTAYSNIENIMNMCEEYSLEKPLRIPDLEWKPIDGYLSVFELNEWSARIPMLETFITSDYEGDYYLARKIIDGIKSHEDIQNEEAYKEINLCLKDTWVSSKVNNAHWSAYYLNLQKIIDICWEADSIVGPGRGSGVGFILLYVLGITQINPMREKTRTFRWRFLNPARVSVLDVDFDIEGSKRAQVLSKFREVYGDDRVANVATFRTEKSKSAILTAARGLGIDVDIAQYIASLVPADRGMIRSLDQCMYGDAENDWKPIKQFVYEMSENYPELWNVAHAVEGLICGSGVHAGGVIFVDEPFTESTALMRAPDGTICTQFELHDSEAVSLIKYDALSVEAMDKIHNCIDLLCDYGYAERKPTLKETYENIIGIYNIERDAPDMWKMVWNHEIQSLFQMEKQSGIQGIALLKPTSVDDLATLNSVIRLMAQERGGEMPTNKLARFKRNPKLWDAEMEEWGLTEEERAILHKELDTSYGICESQEGFMQLVQSPECGGFDLTWADRLRKSIAKKNPKEFDQLTEEYYKNIDEKGLSRNLCEYVWKVLVAYSRGYGFNKSHTLAYSLIALQEMNLAYKYPIIFWNCACLINDAGGNELEEIETATEAEEEVIWSNEIEDFIIEEEEDDDDEEEDEEEIIEKKKKKQKKINYGKIASAIGKMKTEGIQISPPDINYSGYTFSPDPKKNVIRYGLSGITGLGDDAIKEIISNRPYVSVEDLSAKVKLKKPQIVNLIKAGAFDEFGDRFEIMQEYIGRICDAKKRITLQNMQMMINFNMIPSQYDFQVKVYNFNKYLKKFKMEENKYYGLDAVSMYFYENNFDVDSLYPTAETDSGFMIKCEKWDGIYQKQMDIIRPWVKKNAEKLLKTLNEHLMSDTWNKYCKGSMSKWEMDSTSCYFGEHELNDVEDDFYGFENFTDLPSTPDIENVLLIKGKQIPIFRLSRIIGTVLDRDKNKKLVTLLTKTGVVTVKIYGDAFTYYDKQISERGADGKKHVIEKSWFSRGNKIIVTGIKQEDGFLAKKYSRTPYHLVELITNIDNNGSIETRGERIEVEAS